MNKQTKKHINTYYYSLPQSMEQTVNSTFVKGTIYILDYVQIANKTKFVKEYVDKARYGLDYLPIVGYYIDGDFQDHAIDYYFDDEGNLKEEVLTIPYGTVIAGTSRWEKICMEDGEIREVLAVDGYFWKERNPEAINKLLQNKNSQSMEITIDSYENRDGYIEIQDFNFLSLCILGNGTKPAFSIGKVQMNSTFSKKDQFKIEYEEMLKALDKYISEGDEPMEKVDLNTVVEENVEPIVEPIKEENEEVVEPVVEEEATEPVVEEPVVEEEVPTENFEEKYNTLNGEYADLQAKNVELETQYNALMEEVLQLREYKLNAEKKIREEQETNIFSKFEEISDTKEFKELKNNSANYSLEELEDKAFAIYGRLNKDKASKSTKKDKKVNKEETIIYNTVDSTNFEEHKITNSFSELVNKYKNK